MRGQLVRFGFPGGRPPHCVSAREWRNGRRAGFRCQCPKGRGGSNPPSRTEPWGIPQGLKEPGTKGFPALGASAPLRPAGLSSPDQRSADAAWPHASTPDDLAQAAAADPVAAEEVEDPGPDQTAIAAWLAHRTSLSMTHGLQMARRTAALVANMRPALRVPTKGGETRAHRPRGRARMASSTSCLKPTVSVCACCSRCATFSSVIGWPRLVRAASGRTRTAVGVLGLS